MENKIIKKVILCILLLSIVIFLAIRLVPLLFDLFKSDNSVIENDTDKYFIGLESSDVEEIESAINVTEVIETETVEFTTVDAPIEGDNVDRDVENVRKTLTNDLIEDSYVMRYFTQDNIISRVEDNKIILSLAGCGALGFNRDEITLYAINDDGTYDTYPDLLELKNFIDSHISEYNVVDIDAELFDSYNLESIDENWFALVKTSLNKVVIANKAIYDSYKVKEVDSTNFIVCGVSGESEKDLISCSIMYSDGYGTYLSINEIK